MSIRKRGNRWIVDVGDGARRVRRAAPTAKAARQLEADLRKQLRATRAPAHGLEAALLRYVKEEIPRLKAGRSMAYKCAALRPFIVERTFDDIPDVVQEMKESMLSSRKKPATINRLLALLRRLCSLAFRSWGWIENPVGQKIALLQERNERHVYLTPAEFEKLAAACRQPEADALRLLAYTGMRRGELLALMEGRGQVADDCIILGTDTKTSRPRTIPVPPPAMPVLQRLPLMLSETTLKQQFERARKKVGMPHVRIHDLRHTYASWLAQNNVSLTTIGALLGHSQAQTTRRYAHLSVDALREATGRLK